MVICRCTVISMKAKRMRTYCPKCLENLGVLNDYDHLQELEDLGASVAVRESETNEWKKIPHLDCNVAEKTLIATKARIHKE